MSVWKSVTKFFSNPVVRVAGAGAGIASGFGAFNDSDTLFGLKISPSTAIGALNLASGLSSQIEKKGPTALNIAQMGLGGFNVLQNNQVAGVGGNKWTFQDAFSGNLTGTRGLPQIDTGTKILQVTGQPLPQMQTMDPMSDGVTGMRQSTGPVDAGVSRTPGVSATPTAARLPAPPTMAPRMDDPNMTNGFATDPDAMTAAQSRSWSNVTPTLQNPQAPIADAPMQVVNPTGGNGDLSPNWRPQDVAAPTGIVTPNEATRAARTLPGVDPTLVPEAGDFATANFTQNGSPGNQGAPLQVNLNEGTGVDNSWTYTVPGETMTAQTTGEALIPDGGKQYKTLDEAIRAGAAGGPAPGAPAPSTAGSAPTDPKTGKPVWYERVMDRMTSDPLSAVMAGSILVSLMADNGAQAAADEYAARVAQTRAQIDPNSSFAVEYKNNYMLVRQNKLDEEYQKLVADYDSKMSARGMTDSTVYTEGLSSIRQNYLRIKSEIPAEANNAYLAYVQGLSGATAQTLAPDAQVANMRTQAAAGSAPNFGGMGTALAASTIRR